MKDLRDRINSSGRRNPGSFLREHLMAMNATQAELADALGVSRVWLNGLLTGRCSVSAGMALRLGHVLATGPAPWIRLQNAVDLRKAEAKLHDDLQNLPVLRPGEEMRAWRMSRRKRGRRAAGSSQERVLEGHACV